jgi:peptidyl-prolyl cis-trans isomerase A (cyclophilin A)
MRFMRISKPFFAMLALASATLCHGAEQAPPAPAPVPDVYRVKFETSKGDFVIEVTKAWAPLGAARFYRLVQQKYYDNQRFFRVIKNFMVQFGISGDPAASARWRKQTIRDDKVIHSNTRGMVTYAMAGPNTRTTQTFINYGNNSGLDNQGFSPFGKVVEGMTVVDSLYSGYDDSPDQDALQTQGNAYLAKSFPLMDYIKTARIVPAEAK